MPQCKFSLYLKKAGLASRNIVHFLKKVILRCIGLCFNYHHLYLLSRLDQPLIQRIPAGLSSTVACLDITYFKTARNDLAKHETTCFNLALMFLLGAPEIFCDRAEVFLATRKEYIKQAYKKDSRGQYI